MFGALCCLRFMTISRLAGFAYVNIAHIGGVAFKDFRLAVATEFTRQANPLLVFGILNRDSITPNGEIRDRERAVCANSGLLRKRIVGTGRVSRVQEANRLAA